ncbi:hypothetical protein AAG570_004604 [Ranatra chinensis]|uniref:Discoidin domain-containing protein n=1 Tax=Ranatra chinensis TaxID=642074 RepID=A0ABD0Y1N4_9HEMI
MASKRRKMFYEDKKQEMTEIGPRNLPSFCDYGVVSYSIPIDPSWGEPDQDLSDVSYDGENSTKTMVKGLGRLVDGTYGGDNFKLDIGYGKVQYSSYAPWHVSNHTVHTDLIFQQSDKSFTKNSKPFTPHLKLTPISGAIEGNNCKVFETTIAPIKGSLLIISKGAPQAGDGVSAKNTMEAQIVKQKDKFIYNSEE